VQGCREAAPHVSFHSMSSGMGAMHSNSISNCAGGTRRFAVGSAARVGGEGVDGGGGGAECWRPRVRGVWGSRQKWRAVTWKGFSNRAGLSSTVTFVTVTHAILEPHPSTAKTQVRLEVCGTKEQMLSGRRSSHAHAGMGGARKGARWSRIYAHACAGPRTC
jgi:hypothetical protein